MPDYQAHRRCPECLQKFPVQQGFRYRQGFPAILVTTYCSSDCLLDARERRIGNDPRVRWPVFGFEQWRGKRIHVHG